MEDGWKAVEKRPRPGHHVHPKVCACLESCKSRQLVQARCLQTVRSHWSAWRPPNGKQALQKKKRLAGKGESEAQTGTQKQGPANLDAAQSTIAQI